MMCVCDFVYVYGRWFHDISRRNAEKLLIEPNNQRGTFIVRESETVPGLK